jgi:uncharacterized protein (TIGR02001 family)
MKKQTLSLLTIVSLVAGALSACAADVTVTVTPTFVSQYMFRGVRLGGPAFQPEVELTVGDLGVGVWASTPIDDKIDGVSDPEIDPYIYYTIKLSEKLSLEPGVIAYAYPCADEDDGYYQLTVEPYVGLDYTIGELTLSPKVYYDVILEGPTFEFTAAYTVPLEKLHTQLDFSAMIGTYWWNDSVKDASPRVKNYGNYFQVGVSLPFEITKNLSITPGVAYTEGFCNYYDDSASPKESNGYAEGHVVGSLSMALSF